MRLLRPSLAPLEAYVPAPSRPGHRLHLNESPGDLPRELKEAALARVLELDWSRYPEEAPLLAAELAAHDGVSADNVLLGNGSNELLQLLFFGAVEPGDAVVLAAPSFSVYGVQAAAAGARIVEVPLREREDVPFAFDVERLARAAVAENARLVFVTSPNNPTGTTLSADEVKALHDAVPGLLVVDEAYRHFAPQDFSPLLASCERLVLLRTFSKSFAAAALRLGYLLASPYVRTELVKLQMPYNLGAVSASLAREVLSRRDLLDERIAFVMRERERMVAALSSIEGLRVEPAYANFILMEHASLSGADIARRLASRDVLIRSLGEYAGCRRCVRVSVGSAEANDAVIAAMKELA